MLDLVENIHFAVETRELYLAFFINCSVAFIPITILRVLMGMVSLSNLRLSLLIPSREGRLLWFAPIVPLWNSIRLVGALVKGLQMVVFIAMPQVRVPSLFHLRCFLPYVFRR